MGGLDEEWEEMFRIMSAVTEALEEELGYMAEV